MLTRIWPKLRRLFIKFIWIPYIKVGCFLASWGYSIQFITSKSHPQLHHSGLTKSMSCYGIWKPKACFDSTWLAVAGGWSSPEKRNTCRTVCPHLSLLTPNHQEAYSPINRRNSSSLRTGTESFSSKKVSISQKSIGGSYSLPELVFGAISS